MEIVFQEFSTSDRPLGYKQMQVRNYSDIGFRETVRLGLKYLDLEGVELRTKKMFRKRTSTSYSPIDIIHISGYDN